MSEEKNIEQSKNSVEELVHHSIEDFKKALLAGIDKNSNKEYADIKGLIDSKFDNMNAAVKASRKKSLIISAVSIFICVFVVAMVFVFFTHGDRTASKKINEQTQHSLRTIVNLVGEKQMQVRVKSQMKKLINSHKDYILKYNPKSWIRDYSDAEIQEMSIEAVRAFRDRGVQPELLLSIFASEDMCRRHRTSHKGAQGCMQIMPMTADFIKRKERLEDIDPFDPSDSFLLASYHIRDIRYFGSLYYDYLGKWGIEEIAGGYNSGINHYGSYLYQKKLRGKNAKLNKETTEYVKKVAFYYENFIMENPNYNVIYERAKKKAEIEEQAKKEKKKESSK